jgi:two-component system, LytTR family, response regulator LytT
MDCIIIEDEQSALEHLENELALTGYKLNILARIDSVDDAVYWLKNNKTDIIFLDVQLSDGLSFEIFDHVHVNVPVIFTTSYDQYAIKAFEVNSISYLLKPVYSDDLKRALDKYFKLHESPPPINEQVIPLHQQFQSRFLVRSGKQWQSLTTSDIAYFYLQDKRMVLIVTHSGKQFIYDSTMEILEQRLDPASFFRANRRFILSYGALKQFTNNEGRLKLEVEPAFKEELLVSINKVVAFKNWLDR